MFKLKCIANRCLSLVESVFDSGTASVSTSVFIFSALMANGRSASAAGTSPALKVITFNTWLLELHDIKIASNIDDRLELMARDLRVSGADVVNLIEVWQEKNANKIVAQMRDVYPYCSFDPDFRRDPLAYSNGLLVFSKYPLKSRDGFHYRNGCTRPLQAIIYKEVTRPDENFVSKGAIHNVLLHPTLGPIDLFSSHLGAISYSQKTQDYSHVQNAKVDQQAEELTTFIDEVSETPTQFLMIDSNRNFRVWKPGFGYGNDLDPTYTNFLDHGLADSFMSANQYNPHTLAGLYTFDTAKNPNAGGGAFVNAPSDFIDYIFIRSSDLVPQTSQMIFTKPQRAIDEKTVFLSDHFGIYSTFAIAGEPVLSAAM